MSLENENRDSVITVQGGGAYGLSLLGQLKAVLEKYNYTPLALAGSSAGAIVATLVWSGLSPSEIHDEFRILSSRQHGLMSLLGTTGGSAAETAEHFQYFSSQRKRLVPLFSSLFSRSLLNPFAWGAVRELNSIKDYVLRQFRRRGVFDGDILEEWIDGLLRRADDIGPGLTKPGELLRFKHFSELAAKNQERSYRPPLLLTITNLKTRRLEIVNSLDPRYAEVPV